MSARKTYNYLIILMNFQKCRLARSTSIFGIEKNRYNTEKIARRLDSLIQLVYGFCAEMGKVVDFNTVR